MRDGIIKGDGTSRLIKATLPETYEEFKAACASGSQMLDILMNLAGWDTIPDLLNKANLLSDAVAARFSLDNTAVINDVLNTIGGLSVRWKLIAKFTTAGPVKFTVPQNVEELGIYLIGAGGGGASAYTTGDNYQNAGGGAGGYGKNFIRKVTPGETLTGVVGAGGEGGRSSSKTPTPGKKGGTTSFSEETADGGDGGSTNTASGGQGAGVDPKIYPSGTVDRERGKYLFGSMPTVGDDYYKYSHTMQTPQESQNWFDSNMVTLAAGGNVFLGSNSAGTDHYGGVLPDGTKGGDGMRGATRPSGIDATGNGNGGGGYGDVSGSRLLGGRGSDGAIYIYARGFVGEDSPTR